MLIQSIEHCFTLSTTDIKHHLNYSNDVFNKGLQWANNIGPIFRINYSIIEQSKTRKKVCLSYSYSNEERLDYSIQAIAIPTNLGIGKRWYFICPKTKKRCLKLIRPQNELYFLHRTAFPKVLYQKQRFSRKDWAFIRLFEMVFEADKLEMKIREPYRKKHYRGKPTPLKKKLIARNKKDLNFDIDAYDELFLGFRKEK